MFNLVSILTGVVLAKIFPGMGRPAIEGMAYGVVAGGFVQALIQWPVLRKVGYRPIWSSPLHQSVMTDPGLRRMMFLMIPGTVGLAATQINILVNSVFATSVGEGAVSWLNYSFRLMQFPIGIFGVSLATATLPVFSRHWTSGDFEGASDSVLKSVRRVFAINFPASAGLGFLGVPIISLIFEHGRFHHSDTQATASALAAYAVGLTFYSVVKVLVPICYAMGETRVAVISSFFSVLTNLVFNLLFVKKLGFVGLAFGTSLTAILNSILLWFWITKRMGVKQVGPKTQDMLKACIQFAGAALFMGVVVWCLDVYLLSPLKPENPFWFRLVRVMAGVVVGVGSYLGISILSGLKESLEIVDLFKRRLSRGRS
jgi:putative peptidoglycan lipid II flippase